MTTTTKETTTMKKVKKVKKKTSLSSLFLVNFFNFFFYASFCVMKIERTEAHWKIADGLIISEVGTRATCMDGTSSYFEIFMAQEGKIDLAGYTIQADEEVIFTFSDFTKPIEAGEARVVCTGDSSEDIWYSIPPTAGTITAGKNYKLVSKEGAVVDESGVVEEGTVGTANEFYSWQRQRTYDPTETNTVTAYGTSVLYNDFFPIGKDLDFALAPGSPGIYNSDRLQLPVVINEFSDNGIDLCEGGDFIELYNIHATTTVDLSGFVLARAGPSTVAHVNDGIHYIIPSGTTIGPQSYKLFCSKSTDTDNSITLGYDWDLREKQGCTLYTETGYIIDSIPYVDGTSSVAGRSMQRVPSGFGPMFVVEPMTPNAENFIQSASSVPANGVPTKTGSNHFTCCYHIRSLGMPDSVYETAGLDRSIGTSYDGVSLVNEWTVVEVRIPREIPASAGAGFADNQLFDFQIGMNSFRSPSVTAKKRRKLLSHDTVENVENLYTGDFALLDEDAFPEQNFSFNRTIRFEPGITSIKFLAIPRKAGANIFELVHTGVALAGENTWNKYQPTARYTSYRSTNAPVNTFQVVARKKKIFKPTLNENDILFTTNTYNFPLYLEGIPSNFSRGRVKAAVSADEYVWSDTKTLPVVFIASGMVFSSLDGAAVMKLTPDTKTTTFSVYATEVGEIEYSIAPVEGYVMSEEYEYDSTKTHTGTIAAGQSKVTIGCVDNYYVKKISEGTLTCEPCPKNTALVRDASNLEAQSELMCKCIPGLVDLRLPGMLPENFTITSSLSVSPCVSPIKYCQDMTSNLKEYPSECVEFFNGAPVQILTNYYRFKFDRWTWNFPKSSNVPAVQSKMITTEAEVYELEPEVQALECTEKNVCALNATGLFGVGCEDGSTGPLCGVCKDDFYWDKNNLECTKCKAGKLKGMFSNELIAISVVGIIFIALMLIFFLPVVDSLEEIENFRSTVRREYRLRFDIFKGEVQNGNKELQYVQPEKTLKQRIEEGPKLPNSARYRLGEMIWNGENTMRTKVKILVGFGQILVLWPTQLQAVAWPKEFTQMTEALKLFSLDFRILPLDCAFTRDFYSKFTVATVAPLVLIVFICAFFFVRYVLAKTWKLVTGSKDLVNLGRRYVGYATKCSFLLLFLIYPSLSGTVLQYFSCKDVGDDNLFIRYSIETSCQDDKYKNFKGGAIFFVILFPVGIPLLFLTVMARGMRHIKNAEISREYAETHKDVIAYNQKTYGWIYRDYKQEWWFWEILDIIKKFLLGAVVIFVDPGSDTQLYVAMFLSSLFLLFLACAHPYSKREDNMCAQLAHFSLGAVATFGLAIKNEVCIREKWECSMMDVYLVLTVVFVFVCSIALGVSESIEMRKSKRDFLKYDSDYSGDLDKDEMRVLLTDLKIESTEKVLKMIFDKFDKNLSDSIDFEEFIEVGIWIHNELPKQKLN